MKCSSKAFLLLFSINLAFSCSENKDSNQDVGTKTENAETITINGTVNAASFGKDGYTADVQTETEGIYAALVSIVNVGGRENYKPCDIGDKVSFKGVPSVLEGVKQLKVTEIINITPAQTE